MAKWIIHIGLHKTGTSFLQTKYLPNVPNSTFVGKDFELIMATKEIEPTLLLSSEAMSGRPWNKEWKLGVKNDFTWMKSFIRSIENLKRIYPEANIVVVFRKHGDLLVSLYKQYIQEGGTLPFHKFYNPEGVIHDSDLDFEKRIKVLRKHFIEVDILSFEKFKLCGMEYYDDFFELKGYGRSNLRSSYMANKSISGQKVELLRRINKVYPKSPQVIQNILSKNHMTPRKILQSRLNFWKSKDPEKFSEVKLELNEKFKSDWKFVEENLTV